MKKLRLIALLLVVVVMCLSFPLTASAGSIDDMTTAMKNAGSPQYYVNLFTNFLRSQNPTSAQIDQLIGYVNSVSGVIAGRDPYSLSQPEQLAVLQLGIDAAQVLGLTMTYQFKTDGPGAMIVIWDTGTPVLQFGTRDTGIVQTGYVDARLIIIPILMAAAAIFVVFSIRKKNRVGA